ncbi:hypothetical protein VQH23_07685 [Pararoseomonas sp. SCSIO 73927]|uniref:hypothetical protein n=1 Tax=Pararoseomonas sp. SCSIO 73927 TaxID=3114537 RepID=UPI0030D36AF3
MTPHPHGRRAALGLAALLLARPARAADALPAPVNGITFDEWTSANARLAAGRPLSEILGVLRVSEADWNAANKAFLAALTNGDPAGPVFARYGEVFARPEAGRFGRSGDTPKPAVFESAETYLRVQAEMTAAQEVGQDPVRVLQDRFGLTPYDYSQAGARWTQHLADTARTNPDGVRQWNAMREAALAEARARYASGGDKRDGN